jgi:hypothetical protein
MKYKLTWVGLAAYALIVLMVGFTFNLSVPTSALADVSDPLPPFPVCDTTMESCSQSSTTTDGTSSLNDGYVDYYLLVTTLSL